MPDPSFRGASGPGPARAGPREPRGERPRRDARRRRADDRDRHRSTSTTGQCGPAGLERRTVRHRYGQRHGPGHERRLLEHAFEPFFTTKPRGEGTGLGLATVYGIVTEAGGTVILYSEGDLGTTVRVYLPAADEPARWRRHRQPRPCATGAGETILVVEDEQAMREVAVRILRRNGYRVLDAADGDKALAILDDHVCDMLLTDVIMPQMSGHELVERAHARHPDLLVLYMSGYSRGGASAPNAHSTAASRLIQKPFSEQALLEKVRAVFAADGPDAG